MTTAKIDTNEVLVDCQSVWKIFGKQAPAAMDAVVNQGLSKTQILQNYGCVVGVSDVSPWLSLSMVLIALAAVSAIVMALLARGYKLRY